MSATASPLRYALRRARHGWRQHGALLLVAALAVAVGSAGSVGLFSERVRAALVAQSGESIGADALLQARRPIPDALAGVARDAGLRTAPIVSMPSVVFGPAERSALASLKAVGDDYPLRSGLRTAGRPFGEAAPAAAPRPGTVYVDSRLWAELGLSPGAEVQVGSAALRVAGVLTFEPDRGGGFRELAPRLMLHHDDLERAGLTGPGARVAYALQLAGPAEALDTVRAAAGAAGVEMVTPTEARRELAAAMDRADRFLDLTVVCALVLAAAAAMIAADGFGRSLRDEAALLRVLGASRAFVGRALLALMGALGLGGIALGLGVAWGGQAVIAGAAGALFDAGLPLPASWWPAAQAALLGAVLLVGFAMPSILAVRDVSPMRVFQHAETATLAARGLRGAACVALLVIVGLQARSLTLTAAVIAGAAVAVALLYLIAQGALRLLDGMRHSGAAGAAWRLGLANLARRRRASAGLASALGLVLLALLLMAIVRGEMLSQWRASLPAGTPNIFLVNVQHAQRDALADFLTDRGLADVRLWPMARGRLVGLRGEQVSVDDFDDPETQRWINRDFNLSWSAALPPDNRLTDGQWWNDDAHGEPLLSADDYAVERLDVAIGDTMTLRFAGRDITFTVANLREVQWDSFRPNFFLMTTPGALDPERVPVSWLTSFHLSGERGALLRALVERFPNVTPIDIDALLEQVRAVIDRIVQALAFLLAFALAAGVLVLLAAIETSRTEREQEVALLRALGARRHFVARTLLVEYGVLGATAGAIAAAIAQLVAWQLAMRVFDMPFAMPLWPWLAGPLGGGLLVGAMGWLALRGVTMVAPDRVLRLQG